MGTISCTIAMSPPAHYPRPQLSVISCAPAHQPCSIVMSLCSSRAPWPHAVFSWSNLKRKTDPCRHAEWWLLIDRFFPSLFAAVHKLCVFFPRPLSVSTTHHRPAPVAGDHGERRRVRRWGPMWPRPTRCYQLLKWSEFHFISIIQIRPKNKHMHRTL